MNIKKSLLLFVAVAAIAISIAIAFAAKIKPPILHSSLGTDDLNSISVSTPLWGAQAVAVVFVDTQQFAPKTLGQRIARLGLTAVIVDAGAFFNAFTAQTEQCLGDDSINAFLNELGSQLPQSANSQMIFVGIAEGAVVPFINALSTAGNDALNLSIAFSVKLPAELELCPPLLSLHQDKSQTLTSAPEIEDNWRAVWTDQPADETGVFIRNLGAVDTRIAPYDTPLDKVLIEELNTMLGNNNQSAPPMPVVEVPAAQANDSVTLFYSGDGGWRDLDRTVAGEMAAQNYPVVGVDVLRYFWEHKTPEQAAADLSATLAFYRQRWGVKSFVLAGYSFGADILPPIYNRLPAADQDSVSLLVLLALADHADFEIHVSGWLGQAGGELALAPELAKMPKQKILCVYGAKEKTETACTGLANTSATLLELPGEHHFDQDYPKLTRQILDVYRQHGIH